MNERITWGFLNSMLAEEYILISISLIVGVMLRLVFATSSEVYSA